MGELLDVALLKELDKLACPDYDESWLPMEPNNAFLTCIAMGPWKQKRRTKVKNKALQWLGGETLDTVRYAMPSLWAGRTIQRAVLVFFCSTRR